MKFRTTAKAIRNNYEKIISISYCCAQSLLRYQNAVAYTRGIYGWNFDLYDIGGVAICTGYRGMPKGIAYDYERLKFFDEKAEAVLTDLTIDYKRREAIVNKLLRAFIREVLRNVD